MEAKLDMVLEQVGRDKNIDKGVLIGALEQAILTAAKRTFGMNREMEAKFNPETGSVDLFLIVNVVDEDDAIEGREITVAEAHKAGLEAILEETILVLDGGAETTRTVLSSVIRELALQPDQRRLLIERPGLLATAATEEFIR